ncbi:transcriptional coactivator p15/PC4 family protein, partial [Sulfitobacter pseudonitzschiae]|nr:transcriptional coactivator p15/PC4 family protein [Pseudosulfitobacter pseudonitzschiae]MBM2391420.1 transcriptional coactivator p15/PC4 family protein [Pseudosulfitobacter pseudonitzschiae]
TRDDFKGHDMVNVRVFFDAGGGEMKPGKQGVAFRAALLPDVLNALGQFLGENV